MLLLLGLHLHSSNLLRRLETPLENEWNPAENSPRQKQLCLARQAGCPGCNLVCMYSYYCRRYICKLDDELARLEN